MKGKGAKGGSEVQRYRPAAQYDDTTLAQKREYWRTKKREQRARLSEERGRPKQDRKVAKRLQGEAAPSVACVATPSPSLRRHERSGRTAKASMSGHTLGQSQKERWFQTIKLNKVLPQISPSNYIRAKAAAVSNASENISTGSTVSGSVTSPRSSGTAFNISASSVPPIRVSVRPSAAALNQLQGKAFVINGSPSKTMPEQCVSLPKAQRKAQISVHIQPKPSAAGATTGNTLLSPPTHHVPFKEGRGTANVRSPVGKPSALVTSQAKMAARIIKTRERTRGTESMTQRPISQAPKCFPSLSSVRSAGQYVSRLKAPDTPAGRFQKIVQVMEESSMPPDASTAVRKEIGNLQSVAAKLATVKPNQDVQAVQIKVEHPRMDNRTLKSRTLGVTCEKNPREQTRKLSNYMQFSFASRSIARCRTPRQRFIETQKIFQSQRNSRGKFPTYATVYNTRNVPKIDPNESPEQTAARRREYWRIKKREQRAKQSLEVKNRLKEKDSLMRRVKRYQNILEDLRKARAVATSTVNQLTGSTLTHASETIGGFIKEDGTVTINIPHVPVDSTTELNLAEEKFNLFSDKGVSAHSEIQPYSNLRSNQRKSGVLGDSVRLNRLPPPLRSAQVRVSLPLSGRSINKPPRLLSIRPRSQLERTTTAATNSHRSEHAQITLTHPQSLKNAVSGLSVPGSGLGGCVMKMAVSNSTSSPATPGPDSDLPEEERMAKKREYWRVKKREQRAARATRLKQGLSLDRGNAATQRKKVHKPTPPQQCGGTHFTQSRTVAGHKVNNLPHSSGGVSLTPHSANPIKDEREATPHMADRNTQTEQTICPDIKPHPSPLPLPGPQPEPDPGLSADSQATTLLAVASMKKLLEESLSTVAECKSQPAAVKTEKTDTEMCTSGTPPQQELKPSVPMISLGDEDKVPLDADLTLEIKNWQANADNIAPPCSPGPYLSSTETGEAFPPPPSTEDLLGAASDQSHSPPCLGVSSEASGGSTPTFSPRRRVQRLYAKRANHQHCCSPEPKRLHHPPSHQQRTQQQQQQRQQIAPLLPHCLPQSQTSVSQQQCKENNSPLTQRHHHQQQPQKQKSAPGAEEGSMSSLQKKREYWKLMKRQQRARSRARQKESPRLGQYSRHLSLKAAQPPNHLINNSNSVQSAECARSSTKLALHSKMSAATLTAVHSIPKLLVVSPTTSSVGQSLDTLQVKPPVGSFTCSLAGGQNERNVGPLWKPRVPVAMPCPEEGEAILPPGTGKGGKRFSCRNQQKVTQASPSEGPGVRRWTLDVAPVLPTLTPPDNPLSNIDLLPIEPLVHSPACPSPVSTPPRAQPQSLQNTQIGNWQISPMVPPKRVPGESEEEFMRRKREYWRVKKKEQRYRKAIRDRELSQKKNWRSVLPVHDQDQEQNQSQCTTEQDSGQWVNSCEESEHQLSSSSEAELGYFPESSFMAPIEDNRDALFNDYDGDGDEAGPASVEEWRSRYLMDHDPQNQLLVCTVCGELQYSRSLEAVRAHIEEAHPDTLGLEAPERRRILEAWDEQVSRRERFFTSQLQQRGGALAGTPGACDQTL